MYLPATAVRERRLVSLPRAAVARAGRSPHPELNAGGERDSVSMEDVHQKHIVLY